MSLSKSDLIELAGLVQTSIVDDMGKDSSQKRVAERLLKKIRATYKGMK